MAAYSIMVCYSQNTKPVYKRVYLSVLALYAEGQSACVVVSNSTPPPPRTHTGDQSLGSVNEIEQKDGQLLGATMANSGNRFMVGSCKLHLCNLCVWLELL